MSPGEGPVLVTGGTSGIGLGVAVALASQGRQVIAVGRSTERCRTAKAVLAGVATSTEPVVLPGDTTDEEFLRRAVGQSLDRWDRLDGLVTCAGILARGSVLALDPAHLRSAFETNVVGTWLAIRACLPAMLDQQFGRIVTVGSVLATVGAPERGAYAATKGAVAALTRSVALEVADRGITVNCVAPGPVRTPMNEEDPSDSAAVGFGSTIPVGRWGSPADVAHAVLPLLAVNSSWVTGAVLTVDGGYTAR